MNFTKLRVDSDKVKQLTPRISSDPSFRKEFTATLNKDVLRKLADKYDLSDVDVMRLRTKASSWTRLNSSVTYSVNVQKQSLPEGIFGFTESGTERFYKKGLDLGKERDVNVNDMVRAMANTFASFVSYKKDNLEVDPMPNVPNSVKPQLDNVNMIVALHKNKEKNPTIETLKEGIIEGCMKNEENNKACCEAISSIAPSIVAPKVVSMKTVVDNKERDVYFCNPVDCKFEGDKVESSKAIIRALRTGLSKKTNYFKKMSQHFYGFPVPREARDYFVFLTDFVYPKDIGEIHCRTGDSKYAVCLANYLNDTNRKCDVFYVGNETRSLGGKFERDKKANKAKIYKYRTKCDTMRLDDMKKNRKNDGCMGVFFKMSSYPTMKDPFNSYLIDQNVNVPKLEKYRFYFRYIDIFAVDPDARKYKLSAGTMSFRVIESNYIDDPMTGNEVINAFANALRHAYLYPWLLRPFCMFNPGLCSKLKSSYDLSLRRGIIEYGVEIMASFIDDVRSDEGLMGVVSAPMTSSGSREYEFLESEKEDVDDDKALATSY
jgi:hypothetical protein